MRVSPQEHTPRDYIVIASTHEGEELKIAKVWDKLHRSELLVIAPRHPDRSSQIIKQLETVVGNVDKYIAVRSKNDAINRETKIYILDSVGELTSWYSAAKLIVMAGSFIHRGGHNILEPAHFGKAIIVGPHMENFVDENKLLLDNDAAVQVFSIHELEITIPRLLDNEAERKKLEQNALKAVKPFSNVITDYADVINQ
jgi:3-deoxy-D-manno-octulosonic-acid transferase